MQTNQDIITVPLNQENNYLNLCEQDHASDQKIKPQVLMYNVRGWFQHKGFKTIALKLIKNGINHLDQLEVNVDLLNEPHLPRKTLFRLLSATKVCRIFRLDSSIHQKVNKYIIKAKLHRFFRTVTRGNIVESFPTLNINKTYFESSGINLKYLYSTLDIDTISLDKMLSSDKWQSIMKKLSNIVHLKHIKIFDDKSTDYSEDSRFEILKRFGPSVSYVLFFRSIPENHSRLINDKNRFFWGRVTKLALLEQRSHLLDKFLEDPTAYSTLKIFEFRDNVIFDSNLRNLSKLQRLPCLEDVKLNLHRFDNFLFDFLNFPPTIKKISIRLSLKEIWKLSGVLQGKKFFKTLSTYKNLAELSLSLYFMTTTIFHPDDDKNEITNYFLQFVENAPSGLRRLVINSNGNEDDFMKKTDEDFKLLPLISQKFSELKHLAITLPYLEVRNPNHGSQILMLDSLSLSLCKYSIELFESLSPRQLTLNLFMADALNPEFWFYIKDCLSKYRQMHSLEIQFFLKKRSLWKPDFKAFGDFVENLIFTFPLEEMILKVPYLSMIASNLKKVKSLVEKFRSIKKFYLYSLKYALVKQGPIQDVILLTN